MKFIKALQAAVLLIGVFSSCTKTTNRLNQGISYGITGIEPQFAGSGDTIVVYGAGFSPDTTGNTLTINGARATIVSATAESLTVVVPQASKQGNIVVKTGSESFTYSGPFELATVVKGQQSQSVTWTSDKLYVLEGTVEFLKGAVLTVEPGTTILGDKDSLASILIDDGANVSMRGTAAQPIVFSSVSQEGLRYPGDWGGITLAATASPASDTDHMSYVRIEYAGYHASNAPGAALLINRSVAAGNIQYVQTSYSGGDGFRFAGASGTTEALKYLVAFGDAGEDFSFENGVAATGQFLLGLKDPQYADQLGADGLLVQSAQPVTISNLTLISYDGVGRNSVTAPPYTYALTDYVLNQNSGRGVHIGGVPRGTAGQAVNGTLQLFNSVVAAPWLAGISVDGPLAWANYENGSTGSVVRNTSITYALVPPYGNFTGIRVLALPFGGWSFAEENVSTPAAGFEDVDPTAQYAAFANYNDTTQMALAVLYSTQAPIDNLGIGNMANDKLIGSPIMTPNPSSPLLAGADFSDARLSGAFFDRTNAFTGAFGSVDWTRGWTNYLPNATAY